MPALDPHVATLLDKHLTTHDSDDEDALIAELEAEDNDDNTTLAHLRSERINQLHAEYTRTKTLKEQPGHGKYMEIKDEKEVLSITTSTKLCVVHFMKPDFNRCRIMDEKLSVLAERHLDTRFVSINVDNAPFLVVKLGIQVLPCVLAFIDGVGVDRVLGFEGLGTRTDTFTVRELEVRLLGTGVLVRGSMAEGEERSRREVEDVVDEGDDWD
ncbi:hypothetical protein LTR86_002985 [Recurvomyces mirabilis]|nr:hypothetical protein LTR86_002985 [Recurvomyces mirabilis]